MLGSKPPQVSSDSSLARAAIVITVLVFAASAWWTNREDPDNLTATFTQYAIEDGDGHPVPGILIVPPSGPDIHPDARGLYLVADSYAGQMLTLMDALTFQHLDTRQMTPSPTAQIRLVLQR